MIKDLKDIILPLLIGKTLDECNNSLRPYLNSRISRNELLQYTTYLDAHSVFTLQLLMPNGGDVILKVSPKENS